MATEAQTCAIGILANRPNAQESDSPSNKPPIQPSLPKNYDLIMQNKANFRKAKMNVNSFITKDYRKNDAFAVQKNKPNSNPNKANFKGRKIPKTIDSIFVLLDAERDLGYYVTSKWKDG